MQGTRHRDPNWRVGFVREFRNGQARKTGDSTGGFAELADVDIDYTHDRLSVQRAPDKGSCSQGTASEPWAAKSFGGGVLRDVFAGSEVLNGSPGELRIVTSDIQWYSPKSKRRAIANAAPFKIASSLRIMNIGIAASQAERRPLASNADRNNFAFSRLSILRGMGPQR